MKQHPLRAAKFRLTSLVLAMTVMLSCASPCGFAQGRATGKAERQKQIQSQGAYFDSAVWKTAYRADLSEDEKVAGLSNLWSEVKYNFAYFDRLPDLPCNRPGGGRFLRGLRFPEARQNHR